MISNLKKLYNLNKTALMEFQQKKIVDEQIGISLNEWRKILDHENFKEGSAEFFGKPFSFSHGPSFYTFSFGNI